MTLPYARTVELSSETTRKIDPSGSTHSEEVGAPEQQEIREVVQQLQRENLKVRCPTCQRDIIVNKQGECSRCGLLIAGDWNDDIPF